MITEIEVHQLLTKWQSTQGQKITKQRALTRVDVTADELIAEKKIEPDETFIGTKVIQVNINRELPRVFAFLTESSRFLLFTGINDIQAREFELWFAQQSRQGAWTLPHLQNYYAAAMHGKSYVEIVAANNTLGTSVEYVPASELIFPPNVTDIQHAGLILRQFTLPVTYIQTFGRKLQFKQDVVTEITAKYTDTLYETSCNIYKVYYRNEQDVVMCRWYSDSVNKFLTEEVLHTSGAKDEMKRAIPSMKYPFIQMRYAISADTAVSDFQGRAVLDEPLQEATQALTSAYVNGAVRASGFYPYINDGDGSAGNAIKQLDGIALQHNRVASRKLEIFQPNYPDPTLLNAVQLLRTTASNDAGQTDFATTTKRMTNTTATEIQASEEQARLMSSVGVSLVALYMFQVEVYRWEIFVTNISMHGNVPPELLQVLSQITPVSVVDQLFATRAEKVQNAKNWWEIIKETPAAIPYLLQLIREDLPAYAAIVEQNMVDTKPVGQALVKLLEAVAQSMPEVQQDPNYAKILAAGQSAFAVQPSGADAPGSEAPVEAQPADAGNPPPVEGA